MIARPLTFDETVAAFGDPRPFMAHDGSGVSPEWEVQTLAWAELPAALPLSWDPGRKVERFRCHRLLVAAFEGALAAAHAKLEAWQTVNDFGGCYAFRANRRARTRLSTHCWGAAIDLDVCDNPQGHEPRVHPAIIVAFEDRGFIWGGRFWGKARDGMHFEFADLSQLRGT